MGDIWPYGPPDKVSQAQILYQLSITPGVTPDVNIFAAIAMSESGGDLAVINDTPATGDYSVGIYQVNYYGSLYAGRAAEFGTPQQLIRSGLAGQVNAGVAIWKQQGYGAWGSYNNGSWRQFYNQQAAAGPSQAPGQQTAPLPTDINPPTEDYSATVYAAADQVTNVNQAWLDAATALRAIRDTNPHG